MTQSRWREHSAQVIAQVVRDNPGLPEPELRKAISGADGEGWEIWAGQVYG